ncbi:MAG: ABC-F family ATP-binding cassette domain-containing protein, partial [Eubacterium sp.]|nr:ABC-F family ATP-binding cassette domain-containing protein [Eubacterium sp.]
PTNHLDIESKEAFEDALEDYPGTVITVTHDRYFLNKVPDRILELEQDGMHEYLGKYDYYVEKKAQLESGKAYLRQMKDAGDRRAEAAKTLTAAEERELKKKKEAEERRLEREKARLEAKIEELEAKIAALEEEMCKPEYFSDHGKLAALSAETEALKGELEQAYDTWAEL